jgi:hypothetical protein
MGQVDSSPQVLEALDRVEVRREVYNLRRGRKASSSKIKRKAGQCGISCPLSVTLEQAKALYDEAVAEYRSLKPKAPELRQIFLRDQAKETNKDTASRAAAKRMLREERQRETSRFIRHILGRTQGGSVTRKVEAINALGQHITKESQQDVEAAIMANNEARFRLTEDTPLMQPAFVHDLGYLGCTEAASRILQGTYECPDGTDDYTRLFVTDMQRRRAPGHRMNCTISKEDYKGYWKQARERTSSFFFGHAFRPLDSGDRQQLPL